MSKLFISLIFLCAAAIEFLTATGASSSQYISVFISLLALLVSIISSFKEDIFPFKPEVLCNEIIITPPNAPSHDSLALILPLTFINKGNGAGAINMLALRVEMKGKVKLYTPLQVIDYQKFISGKRKLHAENIISSFNSFALGSRSTEKFYILFSQEENSSEYPFNSWTEGSYTFRLFFNQINNGESSELIKIGPLEINDDMLHGYKQGIGFSLQVNRKISI
jgi:hypothetical protein